MDFFDFVNISEKHLEILNPISTEKLLNIGKYVELREGKKIIDYGCGYGELLALWAGKFKVQGIGIDIREHACYRAKDKMKKLGIQDKIKIVCEDASKYQPGENSFDVAVCLGSTFIWGGYKNSIKAMARFIHDRGYLIIGEAYWKAGNIPSDYVQIFKEVILKEYNLLEIAREEKFEVKYMVRASEDDWDNYEACNWVGLVQWIDSNPSHPEKQQVIDYLHKIQDEYFKYGRRYVGWAILVLNPLKY